MSADNTVIVLVTKGKNGRGDEYRVAHVQASENMFGRADYPSDRDNAVVNREWVLDAFKGVRVFTDEGDAMKEAMEVEKSYWYVEYGVRVIDLSHIYFPASDRKRRQRRRFMRRSHQQASAF